MRITREQYEKAKNSLPKLKKAQETVAVWDQAIGSFGSDIANLDVTEIEIDDGPPSFKGKRKEVQGAPGAPSGRAA